LFVTNISLNEYTASAYPQSLPIGWDDADIGSPSLIGSASYDYSTGIFTVTGSGTDISKDTNNDQMHYAYTKVEGDFTVYGRIYSLEFDPSASAKPRAGLIVRSDLTDSSAYVSALIEPQSDPTKNQIRCQYRIYNADGTIYQRSSSNVSGVTPSLPIIFKIVREGSKYYFYYGLLDSNNNITWSNWTSKTYSQLPNTLYVGIGIASRDVSKYATIKMDTIKIIKSVDKNTSAQSLSEIQALPNKPTLIAQSGDGKASLMWNAVNEADFYRIKISDDNVSYSIAADDLVGVNDGLMLQSGNCYYTLEQLQNNKQYYIKVSAVNEFGETESNPVSVIPEKPTPPPTPTVESAIYGDGWVGITWKTVSKATYYEVYLGEDSRNYTISKIIPDNGLPNQTYECRFTNLTNKKDYYLVLFAKNNVGSSDGSQEVVIKPYPIPQTPSISVEKGVLELTVKWNSVEDAVYYNVLLGTSSNSYTVRQKVYEDGKSSYSYTFKMLENKTYYITVSASNNSGTSPNAQEISTQPIIPDHLFTDLVVNDTSNADKWSLNYNLQLGSNIFNDRSYAVTSLPTVFEGAYWISPANDSRAYGTTPTIASFKVRENSDVYVAIDSRLYDTNRLPDFIKSWELTSYTIKDNGSNPQVTYLIYRKSYPANSIVELGSLNQTSGCVFYFVFAKKQLYLVNQTGGYTNNDKYTLDGVITKGASLTITQNGNEVYQTNANNLDKPFSLTANLSLGNNIFEFTGVGEDGYISKSIINVIYDNIKPQASFKTSPPSFENLSPDFNLKFTPDEDVFVSIKLNGTDVYSSVYQSSNSEMTYNIKFDEGSNIIELILLDKAGNETKYTFNTVFEYFLKDLVFVDDSENSKSSLTANNPIAAYAKINNTLLKDKDIALVIVLYNSQNQMVAYTVSNDVVPAQDCYELFAGLLLPQDIQGYKVKAFIWNSFDLMIPVSNVISLP